jgi:TRAP-type transport system periplasmic protein
MKKVFLVIAAILIVVSLAIVGCSSSPSPSATTAAPPAKTTSAPPAATTTAAPSASTTAAPPASTTAAPPASSPAAAAPVELKLVMFLPDVPPGNAWSHLLQDKVKKISNGNVTIKIVGGPEAIPASDSPSAAQRGTIDIANSMMTPCNALVPSIDSLGRAEYDPATLRKTNNGAFKYAKEGFAKAGIYFLGGSSPSVPQFQTNLFLRKPVAKYADLKGLKIASTGGSNKAAIEAWGAICVPIAFPDYFTAMERGTVDGYNIGTPGIQDFGLTPVTGCMLDECFSSNGAAFLVNMGVWNKLSKAQQDALDQAAIEVESEGSALFDQIVAKVRDDISKANVKLVKFNHDESVKFYLGYRDAMWAQDIKQFGDAGSNMKNWLVDPGFARAK